MAVTPASRAATGKEVAMLVRLSAPAGQQLFTACLEESDTSVHHELS